MISGDHKPSLDGQMHQPTRPNKVVRTRASPSQVPSSVRRRFGNRFSFASEFSSAKWNGGGSEGAGTRACGAAWVLGFERGPGGR